MRTPRPVLISLTFAAALGAVLLVHGLNVRSWLKAHPEAQPHSVAEEIPEEQHPTTLSALQLLHRDPPRGDVSAGQLSLQATVPEEAASKAAETVPAAVATEAPTVAAEVPAGAPAEAAPGSLPGEQFEPLREDTIPATN